MFCTKTKLKVCAAASITEWNTTAAGTMFSKKIGVDYGINRYIGYRKQNDVRILEAAQKCSSHYRRLCQHLWQQYKKSLNTTSYQYAACSTNVEEKIMK